MEVEPGLSSWQPRVLPGVVGGEGSRAVSYEFAYEFLVEAIQAPCRPAPIHGGDRQQRPEERTPRASEKKPSKAFSYEFGNEFLTKGLYTLPDERPAPAAGPERGPEEVLKNSLTNSSKSA